MITLSPKICAEISAVVETAATSGKLVRLYYEAEKIRQLNIGDNVALEDIIEAIIVQAKGGPGYESDPGEALAAMMGELIAPLTSVH